MPTVEVVVSEGQKDDWRTFVEELDEGKKYDSVSDLVRTAVQTQISRDLGNDGVPDEVEDMFDEILVEMEEFQSTVSHSNEVLEDLASRSLDEDSVERIVENQRELIEMKIEELNEDTDE
jgi:Arc/MetJ-type ribon-helix-helix transcriptional regulator